MKKTWVFFLGLFLFVTFVNQAQAKPIVKDELGAYDLQDENFNFNVRLQSGYLQGTANEIVYDDSNSDGLLSKLIWEIDDAYMIGAGLSIQQQWVALHVDYWQNVEDGNGTMDDYDWLYVNQDWSHWSHHDDTEVEEVKLWDINAEFMVPQLSNDQFVLSGFLGYKKEKFRWSARGGSFVYTTFTMHDTVGTFTPGLKVISYEQEFSTPYLGIGARGTVGKLELSGRLIGSKWVEMDSRDDHYLRDLYILTDMESGDMISYDITASYAFSEKLSLDLAYNYTEYSDLRADAEYHYYSLGSVSTYDNGQGADMETSMFSIALNYKF